MKRREFLALVGGATLAPLVARAQQPMPLVGFLNGGVSSTGVDSTAAFRKGLSEAGLVEGRNVAVEYHWFGGEYDRVPAVIADLIRRRVAVIATPGFPPGALAVKAATSTIPLVFGVGDDPVKLGLVASLARPDGNVTGINFFVHELVTKRLGLMRELVPKAVRIAVVVNPGNAAAAEATIREARAAAITLGMEILPFSTSSIGEIDAAFAAIASERADALLIGGDGLLQSRRGQFATLAARDKLPSMAPSREFSVAGTLMSYGTNVPDMFRQVGIYAGSIVKGAKPADLPVLQSTKFEFAINLQTARALGISVPPTLLARADEVIE
ncbi:MAG TPA: ABC transporter substrate-binding protein [Xanthobacteraceae bacterium]|nr:ABC transporter substrate-binding protein [Xanthobacteraceae bacterium]